MVLKGFKSFYKKSYKRLLVLPALMFVLFAVIAFVYPGIPTGIDIEGGTLIILRTTQTPASFDADSFKQKLEQNFTLEDLSVNTTSGPAGFSLIVEFSKNTLFSQAEEKISQARSLSQENPSQAKQLALEALQILKPLTNVNNAPQNVEQLIDFSQTKFADAQTSFDLQFQQIAKKELGILNEVAFQKKEIGPTIGNLFWQNALFVFFVAVISVTIVIFLFFRQIVPSIAVMLAAFFDVLAALAGMALFNIPLSLASIPALLLLIGYSIDTDIMLTTKILKRRDADLFERANDSLLTGLTMTGTTLIAVTLMAVLSFMGSLFVIYEIAAVILFGLIGDLISTWFMNAPILLWFAQKKRS